MQKAKEQFVVKPNAGTTGFESDKAMLERKEQGTATDVRWNPVTRRLELIRSGKS